MLPFWHAEIAPTILSGKRVVIAAHGNSLRALVKYLDNLSEETIAELNIPTGVPLVYNLDKNLKPIPHPDALAPLQVWKTEMKLIFFVVHCYRLHYNYNG